MSRNLRYSCSAKDRSLPLYIDSVGILWDQESVVRPGGYPYAHFISTSSGCGKIKVSGKEYMLNPGSGIFIMPGIEHSYHLTCESWQTSYFTFGGALLKETVSLLKIPDVVYLESAGSLNRMIEKIYEEISKDDLDAFEKASGYVYPFLLRLQSKAKSEQLEAGSIPNILKPLIQYIEAHYMEEVTTQDLTDQVHYSIQYITRLFKQVYGISPYRYLQETRIRKAKEMLVSSPEMSILDVAMACGFNDSSYFISQFKKSEKMTPRAFRKLYFQ